MPVALVNGNKLIELLFKYKVGVKENTVSVFSIDTELFENELCDSATKNNENKSRSIWPLPGGIYSYIGTLDQLLDRIIEKNNSRKELVEWFVKSFDNVSSEKTANEYLNVPKNMGLIDFKNGWCMLTPAGNKYKNEKNLEFLFETISNNIMAFEEVHQFLLSSPKAKSEYEILEYIVENFDVEWSTLAQVNFRLLWLINLGKVEKTDNGYKGK